MDNRVAVFFVLLSIQITISIDNGLGVNPPMGWRSWNCYNRNINQTVIQSVIDAMVDRSRTVNGKPTSYADVGYSEVGVDDNWQFCLQNGSAPGHYFHNDTAPNGYAIVNTSRFHDLAGLVEYAHSKKVGLGWYMNNWICSEHPKYPANEVNDVNFLRMYDLDGVKLDSGSSSGNISNWQRLINETGPKPLLTENCHNGPNNATLDWCPFNFFRTSGDINGDYMDIIGNNLQSVLPFSEYPGPAITRQGCFAYPDMLEVGHITPQKKATAYSMDRTHFGAWIVVSAPLILGYDVTNQAKTDSVWDILTNTEAIAVSQTWAGHPGTLLDQSTEEIYYEFPEEIQQIKLRDNMKYKHVKSIREESTVGVTISGWQIWGKPQTNGKWAVLMMNNNGTNAVNLTLDFSKIPGMKSTVTIRSIWDKKDLGSFTNSYTAKGVLPFDSAFLMVTPSSV
eukprot:223834_1